MLVITRFRLHYCTAEDVQRAAELFRSRPGCLTVRVGRNVDDETLWVLQSRWEGPGAYRRALSAYEIKLHWGPLSNDVVDEPGAYEEVEPGGELNVPRPRSIR